MVRSKFLSHVDKSSPREIQGESGSDRGSGNGHRADGLIDLIDDGVVLLEAGQVSLANAAFLRMSGHSLDEVLGRPLYALLTPEAARLVAESRKRLGRAVPVICDVNLQMKEGGVLPVEAKIASVEYEGALADLVTIKDIRYTRPEYEAAKEAARRYQAIVDNPLSIVFVNDQNGLFIDANDYAITWLGYTREELGGVAFQNLVHPDDLGRALGAVGQAVTKGYVDHPVEIRLLTKSGEAKWVEATGYRISREGEPYVGLGVARDITERKRTEQALKESEERYRLLADNATNMIWTTDMSLRPTYFSPGVMRRLGYSDEETTKFRFEDIMSPSALQEASSILAEELVIEASGQGDPDRRRTFTFEIMPRDGKKRWVEAEVKFLRDEEGKPIGIVGVNRDITDRKLAEDRLREAEKRYRAVWDNVLNLVFVHDENGVIVECNDAGLRMMGYTRDDIGKTSFADVVHPDDALLALQGTWEAMTLGAMSQPIHIRVFKKSGELLWLEEYGYKLEQEGTYYRGLAIAHDITERKRTEQALKGSEAHHRLLADNATDMIWTTDMNFQLTYLSPGVMRRIGYSDEEIAKFRFEDILSPSALQEASSILAEELAIEASGQGDPDRRRTLTFELVPKDGKRRWVEAHVKFLRDGQGKAIGLVGVNRDITDRKLAEDKLRENEERFRALIESQSEGIILVNGEGKIQYQSPCNQRLTGYETGQMIGKSALDLIHPEDAPKVIEELSNIVKTPGGAASLEFRFLHKDGYWRLLEAEAKNLLDNMSVQATVVNFRDITDRRLAEDALRDNEERFRALIENASDGIAISNADGRFWYLSPSMQRIVGHAPGELVGRNIVDLLHPADMALAFEPGSRFLSTPEATVSQVYRLRHKDGSWRVVEAVSSNLVHNPHVRGVISNFHDITDKERAEEALREADKRYHAIFDNPLNLVFVCDETGVFLDANDAALTKFGYTRDDLGTVSFGGIVHPEDALSALAAMTEGMTQGYMGEPVQLRALTKSGEILWVELYGYMLEWHTSHFRALVIVNDITERRKAEEGLREAEKRYRAIFENPLNMVFVVDEHGTFVDANDQALRIMGYTRDELENLSFQDILLPSEVSQAFQAMTEGITQKGYMDRPLELQVVKKSGEVFWIETTGFHVGKRGKDIIGLGIAQDITHRKKAEDALRESEAKFRSLAEDTTDVVYAAKADGTLTFMGPQVERYGLDSEKMVGQSFLEFIYPEDREKLVLNFQQSMLTGEEFPSEFRVVDADGNFHWIEEIGRVRRDESGVAVGITGVMRDVTERKQAEQALRVAEQRYRAVWDNVLNLVFVHDENGVIVECNDAGLRMMGYTRDDIGKTSFVDVVHPDDALLALQGTWEAMTLGAMSKPIHIRVHKKSGELLWLEEYGYKLEQNGTYYRGLAIAHDITEQKRTEEQLRQSQERYRLLVENMTDMVFVTALTPDNSFRVTYRSPSFARATGRPEDEALSITPAELMPPDSLDRSMKLLREELEVVAKGMWTPGRNTISEVELYRRDRTTFPVELHMTFLFDAGGKPSAIVGVARDITERKLAQEALKRSEERFRTLVEDSAEGIMLINADLTISYETPSSQRLTGYQSGELVGKSAMVVVYPEDVPILADKLTELMQKPPGATVLLEARFLRKEGSWRYVEATAKNLLHNPIVEAIVVNYRDITDRKRAEEALREAQKRYQAIFNNRLNVVYVVDQAGMVTEVNDWGLDLLGYTREEVGKTSFADLLHPEDLGKAIEAIVDCSIKGYNDRPTEVRVKNKSGEYVWLDSSGFNIERGENTFKNLAMARDITGRKRAEEALQRSEQYFRSLIENASDAITVVGADNTVKYTSPSVERLFTYGPGDDLSQITDTTMEEDQPRVVEFFVMLMEKPGTPVTTECRMLRRDGAWGYFEVVGRNLLNQPGVGGMVITSRDVTERYLAQEAIRESEEKFRTIFQRAVDAIIYLDAHGKIVDLNEKTEVLCGYKRDELVGHSVFERGVFEPGELKRIIQLFSEALMGKLVPGLLETRLQHRDGHIFPVEVSNGAIVKQTGEIQGFLSILRDVSERKKAEQEVARYAQELARSNADLEQFAYAASHDLQEPLRMVGSYVQLLARRYKGKLDTDADDFINYAVDGVTRMQALINGLLAYSRVSTRGKELVLISCEEALERALANLQFAIEDSHAVITHDPLPSITADIVQLGQLFQNLLGNAIKFRKDDVPPQIHISVEKKESEWLFAVKDNGIGFEQEYADRVFIIFKRLNRDDAKYPGTGIGLSLCKKIAERHGGRMWAESQVGVGSTFRFTIPLKQETE